jgi:DDE superfamily endonuclease
MEFGCPDTCSQRGWHPHQTQPNPPGPFARKGAMAQHPQLGHSSRQRLCLKRTQVVSHYTEPPAGSTTICSDELGPVVPRTFDPAPGWSPTGHRIKAYMDYGRGPEKTWVYGALRIRDGKELTRCASSRNLKNSIERLKDIEADNPKGDIFIISDNLRSHNGLETRTWLEEHPRLHHVFIPTGACWLNLQEGWWRLFRRDGPAGQSFATPREIEQATRVATAQLNRRAKPWIWERPPKTPRHRRRLFCYRI